MGTLAGPAGTSFVALLSTALPLAAMASPIPQAAEWYSPDVLGERPAADTVTARSYRALIDPAASLFTYEPAYFPIFVIGGPPPSPPPPVQATISGYFDLEVRTYTWVTDTAGTPLAESLTESWMFFTGANVTLSNPDHTLTLPTSVYALSGDGSFGWSLFGCPAYPHAPWAPNYYESCSITANYNAGLTGTANGSGFAIEGWQYIGPFGPDTTYRIVAGLPAAGGPGAAPLPGTAPLLLGGWLLLRRRIPARRGARLGRVG